MFNPNKHAIKTTLGTITLIMWNKHDPINDPILICNKHLQIKVERRDGLHMDRISQTETIPALIVNMMVTETGGGRDF